MRALTLGTVALLAFSLIAGPTARAQTQTDQSAPPAPAKVCALPFAVAEGIDADLGYRFWAGLMDQLGPMTSISLDRSGVVAKASKAAGRICAQFEDAHLPAVAKALGATWVVTGRVFTGQDGKIRCKGTAFRSSDSVFTRTPDYIIEVGEREKAVFEMAAYLARLLTKTTPPSVKQRVGSIDRVVASAGLHLDSAIIASYSGDKPIMEAEVELVVQEVVGLLDATVAPYPVPALEELLRSTLILRPGYVPAVVTLGRLHLSRGAQGEAAAAFRWAVELGRNSSEVHDLIAKAYLASNRLDDALASAQAGVQVDSRSAALQSTLGLIHKARGRLDEAERCLRQAIALDPQGAAGIRARSHLAVILLDAGRAEDALTLLDEAMALRPRDADVHYNRALALHIIGIRDKDQDRVAAARAEYEKTIELNPNHARAHCNLGVILAAEGKTAEAITEYEAALAADGTLATAAKNLAAACEKLGDNQGAAAAWLRYAEMPGISPAEAADARANAERLRRAVP